jgi:FkbM family methyltransferase
VFRSVLRRILPHSVNRALFSAAWSASKAQYTLSSGINVHLRDSSDWYIYNEIFVDGDYDEGIKLAAEKPGQLNILDLGANVGMFALRAAHLLHERDYRMICVEGNPRTAERLEQNVLSNRLGNVSPLNALVGEKGGVGHISNFDFSGHNTALTGRGKRVRYLDLSTLPFEDIDLLKCDIEGSEEAFTRNFPDVLSRARVAIFELHEAIIDSALVQSRLLNAGLTRSKFLRRKSPDRPVSTHLFWR